MTAVFSPVSSGHLPKQRFLLSCFLSAPRQAASRTGKGQVAAPVGVLSPVPSPGSTSGKHAHTCAGVQVPA